MRPVDVTRENADELWHRLYDKPKLSNTPQPRYKTDDTVRVALDKPVFRKGILPTFTDEIFRVNSVVRGQEPVHYYLKDHKGERIEGRVYEPELVKIREDKDTAYRIEEVLKRKKKKDGTRVALVKFIGYKDTYWIDESQFVA
jgi:hypothetical protein